MKRSHTLVGFYMEFIGMFTIQNIKLMKRMSTQQRRVVHKEEVMQESASFRQLSFLRPTAASFS
eukprot:NODE_13036_length_266_cov_25.423963_g12123_i0.p1 GENE.NODE_13036_length_266_cov_25.423963_g12123_i0~~NODE_13036_length_266_cov_25.423963_g12123_i0.p1  ORF type:complete len:64 (-),score=8.78 NODE_13036_length_266_cov_25.423963_g12123_i0:51-242(-)